MNIKFSYYYGKEADQYSFFKIPKILYTDSIFKTLSSDAKVLYAILLDRMSLSMKNGWLDEENKVVLCQEIVQDKKRKFYYPARTSFSLDWLARYNFSNSLGDKYPQ